MTAGIALGQESAASQAAPAAEAAKTDATPSPPADTAPAESKPAAPAEAKPAEAAPAPPVAAEAKPAEAAPAPPAPAEAKPAESPPAEAKPAEAAPAPPAPAEPAPAAPAEAAPPGAMEAAPAEPSPSDAPTPETAPAEAAPVEAVPEPPNFEQLADAEVAEQLKLDAEQREQIAEILAERKEKLTAASKAEAPEEDRQATLQGILDEGDKKLAEVLTQVQYGDFIGKPVEKRLQFRFQFLPWEDVLSWFAEQAELSLVVPEAPPRGTFNFADTREYTPTEAIDLMNGVLIHQGFTLVRRGRMLMVINIGEGIPEGVVPQVAMEDLDKRGKNELVTVKIPIGRRPAESVIGAISPLLSPHGKVVSVGATQEVLVTDMAGVIPMVSTVIESIDEPQVSPTPQPESPELGVYEVKTADPETVVSILSQMMESAKFVLDPSTKRINANATPSQHNLVKSLLEKMEEEIPPEKQRVLQVYPIDQFLQTDPTTPATRGYSRRRSVVADGSGAQLVETLQKIVPNAQLSVNEGAKTLVAWATPDDQEKIKAALEKLGVERMPEETRQLQVYRLTKVDPDATLTLLQTILPDANLAVDPQSKSLIALAVPSDQAVIENTLKALQPEKGGPDAPELQFYELALAMPPSLLDMIQKVAPNATVAMDASGERLMAIASPDEHAKIAKTIDHLKKTTFIEGRNALVVYPVSPAQRKRFEAVLSSLTTQLPGIVVIADAQPGELSIWAKPQQHDVLKEILNELKREVPEEEQYQLQAYAITSVDPQSVLTMLQELFPETKLVLDPKSNRLLAWTSADEHARIKTSLEKIEAAGPGEQQPRFEAYKLQGVAADAANASALLTQLQTLVPSSKLTLDSRTSKLIAYATPKEHEMLRAALAKLEAGGTPETTPTVEVYPLTKADPTSTLSMLTGLVPDAQLTLGAKGDRLIARAVAADHETIKATLEKLQPAEPGPAEPRLEFYPFEKEPPASLLTILQNLAPKAQITVDTEEKRLTVLASPSDHETIKATIEKFEEAAPDTEPHLVVYPLRTLDSSSALTLFQTLVPDAQLSIELQTGNLVALAARDEHTIIKDTLDQLQPATPGPNTPELRFHPLAKEPPADLTTALVKLVPKAQITLDTANERLMVVATPADHETIQATLLEFEAAAPDEPTLRFHPLKQDPPTNLTTILQQLVPKAQITVDTENSRLMAVATSEDHDTIQATIEQFETGAAQMPVLRFHPLIQEPPADLLTVLQKLVPTAQVTLDAENKRLMVVATPGDQETVQSTVEEFETNTPLEEPSKLVVYTVTSAQRKRFDMLQPTLVAEMPGMQVIGEADPGELAIWAKPTDHLLLSEIMEQLKAELPEQDQRKLVGYPIKSVDPDSVLQMLQKLYGDTEFVLDLKANRLLVWARPGVHDSIKASLEEIEGAGAPDEQPRFQAFPIYTTDVATIVATLQPLVPNAKLTADPKTKRLIAWGTPTELEIIRTAVESLKQGETGDTAPRLEVYRLKNADPQTTVTLLQGLLPDVQLTLDPVGKRIIAYAVSSDHEEIKSTLERVDAQGPTDERPRFETYPIYGADTPAGASTFIASLQPLVPGAKLTVDAKGRKLIAWGTPEEQEVVRKAVESMGTGSAENLLRLKVYRLTKADPNSMLTALQSLLPDAQLSVDFETKSLVALAVPADHETIQSTVEQIEAEGPAEDRPRFETYPIHGVNDTTAAATFVATLQPLVPQARLTVDVKGRKLVAFGTPDEQEVVRKAVESMGGGGGSAGTTPKLEVYRLSKADPSSVLALMQSLLPDAQFSVDSQSRSLVALAVPADQETIKSTVEKIETEAPEDQPRFETYPIFGAAASVAAGTFTTTLQPLVPGAKLTIDARGRKLIAWGTPEEHEIIRGAMLSLGRGGGTPETTPQVEVYSLTKADPTSTLTLLQNLLPDAQLTVDPQTNSLVALAVPDDQTTIRATLDRLQPEEPGPNTPVLRFHLLSRKPTDALIATLQPLVPKAQITLDAENDRLMAVATPADQEVIQSTLEEFEAKTPPEEPSKLVVYPVTSAQKKRLQAILPTLSEELPGVQVVADDSPDEVALWAKPTQHIVLAQMVEELKGEVPEEQKRQLVAYSVKSADPSSVLTVMQELYPDVKFVLEPKTNRLLVWTRPEEHESIKASLEKIAGDGPAEDQPRFETYAISAANMAAASTFMATLQPLVPNVRLTLDAQGRRLIAWGTPEEHEIVRKALEGLGRGGGTPETTPQLQVYAMTKADPNSTLALLQNLVPDAQLSVDPQTNSIVALAISADQATIKATLEQLQPEEPGPNTPVLRFHLLSRKPTDSLIATLQPLVPKAQITLDAENDRLMAVATPADHEVIQSTLKEFEAKTPPEEPGKLAVYPVTPSQRKRFEALLPTLAEDLPGAQIIPDGKPGELAVWAKPTQHLVIAEIIREITGGAPEDGQFRLGVYTIRSVDPQNVLSVLQRLFPDTEFIVDDRTRRLMVWTSPAEHDQIQAAIDEMDTGVLPEMEEEFASYPVPNVDPSLAVQMLQERVPDVRFIPDPASRTILAFGRKADHRKIAAMLEQMSAKAPASIAPTATLYSLESIDAASATQILQLAVPQARITVGPGTDQLVAWATPRDHEVIESTLAAVDVESAKAKDAKAVIYTLEGMSRMGTIYASRFLADTVPDARFAVGAEENQLVAWATPEVHEQIASLVDQLTQESPEKARRIVVYTVQATAATAAMQVLATAVPQANVTLDPNDQQKLTVWARPTEHETIVSILKEIDAEGAAPTSTVKVYTVEGMTAAAVTTILSTQVPQARVSLGTDPQQLVVWARPADHERIGQLVDEIAAAATEGEAARTARVYTLDSLTATAATTFLAQVVPQARLSAGSEPDQLIAWARPAEHEKIAATLEAIDVEGAEDTEVVVYTLEGMSASAAYYVLNFLTTAVPQARFVQGVEPGQLVAWAKPKDHAEIAKLVEQLTKEAPPEKAAKVAVYTLQSITATNAMQVITTAVPQAKVTLDTNDPQKLTVWARPSEHETIAGILKEIDAEGPETVSTIKIYTIEGMTASAAMAVLQAQVPQARISLGGDPRQLVVWARPPEQERIRQIVDGIAAAAEEAEAGQQMVVYTLEALDATTAMSLLRMVVPQAQLSPGAETDQIVALASLKEHDLIQSTLKQIDVEAPEGAEPVMYTLEGVTASNAYYVRQFLTTAVPDARFVQGIEPMQLIAWAKPKDHEEIAKLVKELTQEPPADKAPGAVVYHLESITASAATQVLQQAVPQATFTADSTDAQKMTVWARPSEHDTIARVLQEIDVEGPAKTTFALRIYTIEGMTASYAMQALRTLVPAAQVSLGSDPQQLVVWARPADHEQIQQMVDEVVAAAGEGEAARIAQVYTLESLTATTAMSFLRQVVPLAQLSQGSQADQLIAWARPKDHDRIASTLKQIDVEGPEDAAAVVYTLEGVSSYGAASYVVSFLTNAIPEARFLQGARPSQVVAWARPKDHEEIAELIDDLTAGPPPEKAPKAVVYNLTHITAASANQVLSGAVPNATLTTDTSDPRKLTALATRTDHEMIASILQDIDVESPAATSSTVKVYTVEGMTASAAMIILQTQVPQARVSMGSDPQQLVIWARPADHERIGQIVEEIASAATEGEAARVAQVYTLEAMTATTAMSFLRQVVPQAELSQGSQPDQLIAWARTADHEKIRKALEQIDVEGPAGAAVKVVAYPLPGMESRRAYFALGFIRDAVPEATLTLNSDSSQLIAWARPKDHERIAE
ncbi:MAG TPA: hypothetical protein VMY37_40165, partial [Thermoguttaceae bacterium]|nr:hypothetical protein [Thermoguttaceae bacterium]